MQVINKRVNKHMISKRANNLLIFLFLAALAIGGYITYLDVEYARRHGVYTIAIVKKLRAAKNGWKVKTLIEYKHKTFEFEHLKFWESFSFNQTQRRMFAKIRIENNVVHLFSTYIKSDVPDSILSAPPEGWSEEWMKAHFPEVVEDVYDTR